jgi:alpha-1,6-mannosyltransferase
LVGHVVVAVGLAVLGIAWLRLVAATHPADRTGADAGADARAAARRDAGPGSDLLDRLRRVRTAAVVWSLPMLVAPPLLSRDAWSYAAQGELTRLGLSPYVWAPGILDGPIREAVDPLWMNAPTPYGPLPLAWGALLAGLSDDPMLLVLGHRLLAVLGLALLAWAVPRLAVRGGQDPARASALAVACPLTVVHGVGGAHNDLVMAGLMAAALVVAFDRSWELAAVLGGAAAAVKVPGGLVCIGVALASLPAAAPVEARVRRLAATGLLAGMVVVGLGLWAGVGLGWVHALRTPGSVWTPMSATSDVGAVLEWCGVPHGLAVLRGLGVAVAVGTAAWVALRGRTGVPAAVVRSTALVTATLVVLSPAVHAWYALWVLPFLAACAWGRVADGALRDLVLVVGIAPLESSLLGMPCAVLAAAALAAVSGVRIRSAGRAGAGPVQAAAAAGTATPR